MSTVVTLRIKRAVKFRWRTLLCAYSTILILLMITGSHGDAAPKAKPGPKPDPKPGPKPDPKADPGAEPGPKPAAGLINYRPKFIKSSLIKAIPENSKPGFMIQDISIYATDDEGDKIYYTINSAGEDICNIGRENGKLTLKRTLDREVKPYHRFRVFAEDGHHGGGAHRRAHLDVFLYVLDINDNPPVFVGTPYMARINESAAIGDTVLTVSSTDADEGINQDVTYQLMHERGGGKFSVEAISGKIKVAGKLDYETETKYTLVIAAKDFGTPQLSAITTVVIDIIDTCDTPPKFKQSSYQTQIREDIKKGEEVLTVSAVDGDTQIKHQVAYSIEDGNDEGMFKIDNTTGVIRVNGTIDREKTNIFRMKIKAWEIPEPDSFSTVDAIVLVEDINDHVPTFGKSHYYIELREDVTPGHVIKEQISATDSDIEPKNNAFEYSLRGSRGMFSIDPKSGQLQVEGTLDYERQRNYSFVVLATETRTRERYTGMATVTIDVINVNDNSPQFERPFYSFEVFENITTKTIIGTVKATDKDSGTFGEVTYQMKYGNNIGQAQFSINSKTGEIYASRTLDYEKRTSYDFIVEALDRDGDDPKTGTAIVRVKLLDVDDVIRNDVTEVKTKQPPKIDNSNKHTKSSARTMRSRTNSEILLLTLLITCCLKLLQR